MLHPITPHKHSPLISHKTIHSYRRSMDTCYMGLSKLKSSSIPDCSPKTDRVRVNKRHKVRNELLLPVLEPKFKLPALPIKVMEAVASGKFGRMASALRIPTTRRDENEDDSITLYREMRRGQGLVFCPRNTQ